jgi:hypothetical protein
VVVEWARFARLARGWAPRKAARESCSIDPRLTKNDGEVRTRAVVGAPKGTVVVGDRRRAPQVEHGCEQWRVRAAAVSPGSGCRMLEVIDRHVEPNGSGGSRMEYIDHSPKPRGNPFLAKSTNH